MNNENVQEQIINGLIVELNNQNPHSYIELELHKDSTLYNTYKVPHFLDIDDDYFNGNVSIFKIIFNPSINIPKTSQISIKIITNVSKDTKNIKINLF